MQNFTRLFSISSPNSRKLEQDWLTYKNETLKLNYPPTWSYQIKNNPVDSSVIFFPNEQLHIEPKEIKVAIGVEPLRELMSLEEYTNSVKKEIIKDNDESKIIEERDYSFLRSRGQKITYEFNNNGSKIKKSIFIMPKDKKAYAIYYQAKDQDFTMSENIADQIVQSLDFVNFNN